MREATGKFDRWIRGHVAGLAPGVRLAADSHLATQWGLSRKTVERVMRALAREGLVTRITGSGTTVGLRPTLAPPTSVLAERARSSDSLASTITLAIRRGEIVQGEALPSVKYIARRFKVSSSTVAAAYRQLVSTGLVVPTGRTLWVGRMPQLLHDIRGRDVYLFVSDQHELLRVFRHDLLSPAYRRMEEVLSSNGFVVRYELLTNADDCLKEWQRSRTIVHGTMLFGGNRAKLAAFTPLAEFVHAGNRGAPVPVVIDWNDSPPERLPRHARVVSRPNLRTTVARSLASYLVARQARALLTIRHANLWGRDPYGWDLGDLFKVVVEAMHIDPDIAIEIAIVGAPAGAAAIDLLPMTGGGAIDVVMRKYSSLSVADISPRVHAYPSMESALAERGRQRLAWCFQADEDAALALQWARNHRVAIGQRMEIVGLDDNPAYYHLGLSRCELDLSGLGYLMAHEIIGDLAVERTGKGFIRAHARVLEKLTTARRPG